MHWTDPDLTHNLAAGGSVARRKWHGQVAHLYRYSHLILRWGFLVVVYKDGSENLLTARGFNPTDHTDWLLWDDVLTADEEQYAGSMGE